MDPMVAWFRDELVELKAAAAIRRTWGDDFKLRDRIEALLGQVREDLVEPRREARRYERNAARALTRWNEVDSFWTRWAERERVIEADLVAVRDELAEALRYLKADHRAAAKIAAQIHAELKAEGLLR